MGDLGCVPWSTRASSAASGPSRYGAAARYTLCMTRAGVQRPNARRGSLLPRRRGVSNAALALATLAGLFTSYVVHTELFYPPNRAWMVVVLAASYVGLFTAFRVIDDQDWGGITLAVVAATAVSAAVWPSVGSKLVDGLKAPGGLLYVGNPIIWIVPAPNCIGGAVGLYVLFRAVHPSRTGWLAFVAAASIGVNRRR